MRGKFQITNSYKVNFSTAKVCLTLLKFPDDFLTTFEEGMILNGGCTGRLYCFMTVLTLTEVVFSKVPRVHPTLKFSYFNTSNSISCSYPCIVT